MNDTCKLCGGKPVTYQWRYFDGDLKGLTVEMCKHEYAQRLTQGEPLALALGQHVPDTPVTRNSAVASCTFPVQRTKRGLD